MWLIVDLHHWFTYLRDYKVLSHGALHAGQQTISNDHFHFIFLVNNFQSWSSWTISMVMHVARETDALVVEHKKLLSW